MANFDIYLEAPIRGESPYVDIVTPVLAGTETFRIHAGRLEDQQYQHWELIRCVHLLTTSVAVANRKIAHKFYIVTDDGAAVLWLPLIGSNNITASQTAGRSYVPYSGDINISEYHGNQTEILYTRGIEIIKGLDYVDMYVSAGEATDTHYLIATFKYKNYEEGIDIKG